MALAHGFADPVHDGQAVFRAVMDALSRPARVRPLAAHLSPPAPLTPELAAIALALVDADTPVWLDPPLRANPEVASFLRFHTAAPLTEAPDRAAFALIADPARCPPLGSFAQGSLAYPDGSTTLVLAVDNLSDASGPAFSGPGIRGTAAFAARPLSADWPAWLAANHAGFPTGVDLLFVASGLIAGLPRSARPLQNGEAMSCMSR